jgi:hypothetical protein
MAAEYDRIYRRSREDPGTAGDEGEANWAQLLSEWLPADLHIATKGRILSSDGIASPQVDVVVLAGDYPLKLREKKVYLAGGVVAAFECKNTLRKRHIEKFFQNAAAISTLTEPTAITLYDETFSQIIYGLLAHSHEWSDEKTAGNAIDAEVQRLTQAAHRPRELPAVITASNLFTWDNRLKFVLNGPVRGNRGGPEAMSKGRMILETTFERWANLDYFIEGGGRELLNSIRTPPNPVGTLIIYLLRRLALNDPRKGIMERYFRLTTGTPLLMAAANRTWKLSDVFSERMLRSLWTEEWWQERHREPKNKSYLP